MSHDRLPTGASYSQFDTPEPWQVSRGKRVVVSLSSRDVHPPTVTIRPDNSRASEECFPLALSTFSVREVSTPGRAGNAGAPSWLNSRKSSPAEVIVLTVNVGTAPRAIIFSPIFNPAGNTPRARDILQLINQRVAAAQGVVIAAPRNHVPGAEDDDTPTMGGDGDVVPDATAPAAVTPPPASERTTALDPLVRRLPSRSSCG